MAQKTTAHHLSDGADVVGATVTRCILNPVAAIVGLLRQSVLEDHQRGHHIGALNMRDVSAFDTQRRFIHKQRVLKFGESLRSSS